MRSRLTYYLSITVALSLISCGGAESQVTKPSQSLISEKTYSVAGTGQNYCYDNASQVACPTRGQSFFGQDASIPGPALAYRNNNDGTVTDLVTGLMWAKVLTEKTDWVTAVNSASKATLAGYNDWRLPSIKELYTLMNFQGHFSVSAASSTPFIDTNAFEFSYAAESSAALGAAGQRFLDVQLWSATKYVATTMAGDATIFGVNFADGRIKGYPQFQPGSGGQIPAKMLARYVRGKPYGEPNLQNNGDGGTTDLASGLTWQTIDDGVGRNWKAALQYCTDLNLAGKQDWRLPNAKELHTILDYRLSPATSNSAAISAPMETSKTEAYYWTSNTLLDGPEQVKNSKAAYFAFGRALGWMAIPPTSSQKQLLDVHGAGSQRTDPKDGNASAFPQGFGPQGDDVRINNLVRCVRGNR